MSAQSDFELHPQLEKDTFLISDLPLCRLLLMNNWLFPWVILVPRISDAKELIDLDRESRFLLMDEIAQISQIMKALFSPDKLNVAALGNQVSQLHIHIIARFMDDNTWPNPVWGVAKAPYGEPEPMINRIREQLH